MVGGARSLRQTAAAPPHPHPAWGRRRLLAVVTSVAVAAVAALTGLVLVAASFVTTVTGAATPPASTAAGTADAGADPAGRGDPEPAVRDEIAARAMLTVSSADSQGGVPAATAAPTLTVPAPTRVGPVQVSSGFPHTPHGGVGQLAAIVTAALAPMSLPRARQVYQAWAMPAGVGPDRWRITGNVQAFLAHAGTGTGDPAGTSVRVVPVAGQVKGSDGPDWVVACVLVQVTAVITTTARIAYGHCERMQWSATEDRWLIAPGRPARARPVDVAGHRGRIPGGLADLGQRLGGGQARGRGPEMADLPNPFAVLASAAGKVVADGWTAAMLGLWQAGLWLLRFVLGLVDELATPDVSADGPAARLYGTTFWIAATLMVLLALVQLGLAAVRRDGRSLARAVVGVGQFVMVWAAWLGYAATVLAASRGVTQALMTSLLGVDTWGAWQPWSDFSTQDITDATVATVLGVMSPFLILAAVGHLLIAVTVSAALLVLTATTPICAAGLVSDAGRAWMWTSLRWFHAAAFTPAVVVLVTGVGVQVTTGVAAGAADGLQASLATAVPGVFLICISCAAPLTLFKLLAFVDPGTSSGAAMRAGLAAQGGVQGLLARSGGDGATSGAASTTDEHGRSSAETGGDGATTQRFSTASSGMLAGLSGAAGSVGSAAGAVLGAMTSVGVQGAVIGADLANQAGVGHNTYVPDVPHRRRPGAHGSGSGSGPGSGGDGGWDDGPGEGGDDHPAVHGIAARPPSVPAARPPGGPSGAGAGGAGAGGAAAGGGAGAVPVIPP